MKKIILVLICSCFLTQLMAQQTETDTRKSKKELRKQRINAIIRQEEEGVIKYKSHLAFGLKLTNDGYGGFVEYAKAQSIKKALLFQLDITERKHSKEIKTQVADPSLSDGSSLIFGKLNFVYPVKLGVQQQFLFGNKGNKNGVSVSGNFGGGISLALLRPYQFHVITDSGYKYSALVYDDTLNAYTFGDTITRAIVGGPTFGKGWSGLKVTPGLYAKAALRFDYGKYNEMLSAIEVGVMAEFYGKKLQMMAFQKEYNLFLSAYVSIVFGRRK